MELIFEEATRVDGFATFSSAGGITTLDDEARDQAVEDGVVKVAIQAELEEVAGCEGGLFGEEVEEDVARGGGEKDLRSGLGLEIIERTHCEESFGWPKRDQWDLILTKGRFFGPVHGRTCFRVRPPHN